MNGFPIAQIGDVATPVERPETTIAGKTFRQIGVRLWGVGAYEREAIDGSQTKYKTLSRVESGDIVVNKIWARNGSVAVVTDELAGCYGSGEFPTFAPDRKKLESKWFHWITKTRWFWNACDEKSQGTSGKNRIRPEKFLDIEIPLPSLDEQRRIVARIEALAEHIAEAQSLRQSAVEEAEALWKSSLANIFRPKNNHKTDKLENLCEAIIDNLHSTPKYDGNEFACIRSQDVGWGTLDYSTALRTSLEEFTERIRRGEPQAGDIVFVREGDIGRCAVVDGSQRFCLGQRVMMFRPKSDRVYSQYLMFQLMAPPILQDQILAGEKGTTSHHVNIKHLRQIDVQLPLLGEQRRIVTYLDDLSERVNELRRLQVESQVELDALLPSVLDRAFKGEL